MIAIVAVSFGWVIYRLPLLKSRHELDSWVSREAAFLANNWILLFSAFFVLFATMFPTLSEAVRGERLTVGPPFFNMWMRPIGLALLVLTGIAPLLAWRKSSLGNLAQSFAWPVAALMVTGAAVYALGIKVWSSGICFALCAFVGATILQEFIRGAQVRQGAIGRRSGHGRDRSRRAAAPPLRRLHRPPRHRPHVPRLRRARATSSKRT